MPELIRSVVSRVRIYINNRRQSPRLAIRLLFSLSICRSAKVNGSQREQVLKGHTRDISAHGLALTVAQVHLDGYHLAAEERQLQLTLELPDHSVSMTVVPNRYEMLDESELGCKYLLGVKIRQISDEDRDRYLSFITRELGKSK